MSENARRVLFFLVIASLIVLTSGCTRHKDQMAFMERPVGYLGGGGGGEVYRLAANHPRMSAAVLVADADNAVGDRKIIRNGYLQLLVKDVDQAVNRIRELTEKSGGFVEKSTVSNSGSRSATVTVRVPTERLDEVMKGIKAAATHVDRETVEARDVTREYIDLDSRLRNVQAEEQQYLQIMKRANTLKDTLEVAEKLSDVRGRIEQLQGEMKYLSAQIAMSSLEVSIQTEAGAKVLGIEWKPLRKAKIALGDMLGGLADWADSVIAFFINLPVILLWLVSIVLLVVVVWRVIRFLWRRYGPKQNWRLRWVPKTEERRSEQH